MIQILVNKTTVFWVIALLLPTLASTYLIGYTAGKIDGKSIHKPYEIDDSTTGKWLIVPDGWSVVSIPSRDTYRKPWKKPTDEEG